jgi:hypothetical protein
MPKFMLAYTKEGEGSEPENVFQTFETPDARQIAIDKLPYNQEFFAGKIDCYRSFVTQTVKSGGRPKKDK